MTAKSRFRNLRPFAREKRSRSNRLGIGEFIDLWGAMPGLLGRLQYLEALATEHPEAAAEIAGVRAPLASAMAAYTQEWQQQQPNESPPPSDPKFTEALLTSFAEVFGTIGPFNAPQATGPSYPALPSDSPAATVMTKELERAVRRLGSWMNRWGLPNQDFSWCIVAAFWAFLADNEVGSLAESTIVEFIDPPEDLGSPMALLNPDRLKPLFERVRPWLEQLPTTTNDVEVFGRQMETLLASAMGRAAPVTFPPMLWNPRVETRAAAEERLRREAEAAIKAQLDAAVSQLDAEGAERTPTKTTGLDHFCWLVRYQVDQKSQRVIANEVCRERQAVRKAITDTANMIGLPLRPQTRPGRPRRSQRPAA